MAVNAHTKSVWIDQTGFAASFFCAIHCAAMPFILIVCPFLSTGIIASIEFEWFMFAVSGILGYLGVQHGLRHHGVRLVLFLFLFGLLLLLIARLYQFYELELLRKRLQIQTAPFLQTFTLPIQSYRYLHALSHKNITTCSVISVLGGILIAASHIVNIIYGHQIKKETLNSNTEIDTECIITDTSQFHNTNI